MSLFTDTTPDFPPPERRRRRVGWIILAVAIVGIAVLGFVPAPYVIEQPGPVFNTLGSVKVNGDNVPLIDIPSTTKTYPTKGTLDMLTVSVEGNREQRPGWLQIAASWLNPSEAVVPLDEIYPVGVTDAESTEESTVEMTNSQQDAIAAALTNLGYTFSTTLTVVQIEKGSAADGVIKAGSIITSVNGTTFADVDELRAAIAANGTKKVAAVGISLKGVASVVHITPKLSSGADPVPLLGVAVGDTYVFPIDVKIQLQNVGGPSAGMMFALGIIDKLTPGELNGGKNVAGTGTISATGEVGAIGGIRQKMYGALDAGAKYFLAPSSNCSDVAGHIPGGLTVYSVSTLKQSMTALSAISSGNGLSSLPTCKAP